VMVAGSPPGVPGTTNMLKVHRMGSTTAEIDPALIDTAVAPAAHRWDAVSGWSPM